MVSSTTLVKKDPCQSLKVDMGDKYQHSSGEVIEGKNYTERSKKSQNEGTANKVYTPSKVTWLSGYQVSKPQKTDTIQNPHWLQVAEKCK